jgi:hypothetical protein
MRARSASTTMASVDVPSIPAHVLDKEPLLPSISVEITRRFGAQAVIGAFALGLTCLVSVQSEESDRATQDAPRSDGKVTEAQGARARWRAQQIVARRAEAEYHNARLAREIAEIAVVEYVEALISQEVAAIDGKIKLAQAGLRRAEDRVDWDREHSYKGFPRSAQEVSDELSIKKARFALEQGKSKRKILIAYTMPKRIKELNRAIVNARSDELAKKATWKRERSKESALEREVIRSRSGAGTFEPQ